jgi:hypothetical protein
MPTRIGPCANEAIALCDHHGFVGAGTSLALLVSRLSVGFPTPRRRSRRYASSCMCSSNEKHSLVCLMQPPELRASTGENGVENGLWFAQFLAHVLRHILKIPRSLRSHTSGLSQRWPESRHFLHSKTPMFCIVVHILASFRVIFRALEGIQIELHGQYSLSRLDELIVVARQMSLLRALAIPLYTPLSCLVTIIILDVLPLRPPTGGIRNQSATYWVRAFASIAIVTVTTFLHFQHASPRLPTMVTRSAIAATVVSVVATVVYGVLHLLIGFPTPFMFEAIGPPWQMLQFCAMWAVWKTCIRENVEVRRDLLQYVWLFTCQYAMLLTYPVMIYVFLTLDGLQQTVFSLGLPIYKLFLKHWASRGVYRVEDLAPLYVVLSVDVFHALMLSCAMQSAASRGTLVSVMAVDVCQSVVAIVEVATIIQRIRPLHLEMLSSDSTVAPISWHTLGPGDVVTMASSILACHPQIRETPVVALPRHERRAVHPQFAWATTRRAVLVSKPRITPISAPSTPRAPNTRGSRDRVRSITKLSPEVEYVRLSLKLLHMVEFYVLIEFTEVILAVIYGTVGFDLLLKARFINSHRSHLFDGHVPHAQSLVLLVREITHARAVIRDRRPRLTVRRAGTALACHARTRTRRPHRVLNTATAGVLAAEARAARAIATGTLGLFRHAVHA